LANLIPKQHYKRIKSFGDTTACSGWLAFDRIAQFGTSTPP